jgi:hypothetical protein
MTEYDQYEIDEAAEGKRKKYVETPVPPSPDVPPSEQPHPFTLFGGQSVVVFTNPNTCRWCKLPISWNSELNGWIQPHETKQVYDDCSSTTDGYHSPQSAWIPDS